LTPARFGGLYPSENTQVYAQRAEEQGHFEHISRIVDFAYRFLQFDLPGVPKMLRFQALELWKCTALTLIVWSSICCLIRVRQFLGRSGGTMTDIQQSPQLLTLCALASQEHDPQKLVRLILKINQKLDLMGESELSIPEAAD
jgi:hypothetical protein